MSNGKKLTYKEKSGISFIAQDDPPFIQEMKKKLGYKAPPKLEDKFADEEGPLDDDVDDPERELLRMKEEDRPQVVVLNPDTDLTQDDLTKALDARQKEDDDQKIADGKIVFRKPVKRAVEEGESSAEVDGKKKREEKKEVKKTETRLLSFGDDDEEDE